MNQSQASKELKARASARIPTEFGEFKLTLYSCPDNKEHLSLHMGELAGAKNVLVRVHSECFTGDVLGSLRCDCGEQLKNSMGMIAKAKLGAVIYMRQEGRGIGLSEKLRAYNLQDEGLDTIDANLSLGHQSDIRDYTLAASIIKELGIESVRLITNNPNKIDTLKTMGITIAERVGLVPTLHPENIGYIRTKIKRMNHLLDLPVDESDQ